MNNHPVRVTGCGLVIAALAACAGADSASTGRASTEVDRPTVVTALYPLTFLTERVAASDVSVRSVVAPGVEPHDIELTPAQVQDIADADLVLYLGEFAPAVDEAVEQNAADRSLEISTVVDLLPGSTDESEGADTSRLDPHFWLDPLRLAALADVVAGRLGELDPARADDFAGRAAALVAELRDLDAAYASGLANCATATLVTSHDAFGYLSSRYGLDQVSIAGLEPEAEPSAARISEVQALVRATGTTTIFFEPLGSSDVVSALAADLGVTAASLDPVESPPATGDYLTVMADNLAALRAGLRCG